MFLHALSYKNLLSIIAFQISCFSVWIMLRRHEDAGEMLFVLVQILLMRVIIESMS